MSCHFCPKTAKQCGMGRCAGQSPIMKWANMLKESSKNSLKPNTASHTNASWYTDTDVFLEYSPSGGSLYYKGPTLHKIIPILLGVIPCISILRHPFCILSYCFMLFYYIIFYFLFSSGPLPRTLSFLMHLLSLFSMLCKTYETLSNTDCC